MSKNSDELTFIASTARHLLLTITSIRHLKEFDRMLTSKQKINIR